MEHMEIRRLGQRGLAVSALGLGTLTWGRDTDDFEAAYRDIDEGCRALLAFCSGKTEPVRKSRLQLHKSARTQKREVVNS